MKIYLTFIYIVHMGNGFLVKKISFTSCDFPATWILDKGKYFSSDKQNRSQISVVNEASLFSLNNNKKPKFRKMESI